MPQIPIDLKTNLEAGRVIPFVGAGVSMAVRRNAEESPLFPDWKSLLFAAADYLDLQGQSRDADVVRALLRVDEPDYIDVAQRAKNSLKGYWVDFLKANLDPDSSAARHDSMELARSVWELGSNLVVTTNFDRVLEWSCPADRRCDLDVWNIEAPAEFVRFSRQGLTRPTLWHLHGSVGRADQIILTPEGYRQLYPGDSEVAVKYQAGLLNLRFLLFSHTFLFIGFSLDDPYFRFQLDWTSKVFPDLTHYALVKASEIAKIQQHRLPLHCLAYEEHGPPLLQLMGELKSIAAEGRKAAGLSRAWTALRAAHDQKGLEAVLELIVFLLHQGKAPAEIYSSLQELKPGVDSATLLDASSRIAQDFESELLEKQSRQADHLRRENQSRLAEMNAAGKAITGRLQRTRSLIEHRRQRAIVRSSKQFSLMVEDLKRQIEEVILVADLTEGNVMDNLRPRTLAERAGAMSETLIRNARERWNDKLAAGVEAEVQVLYEEVQQSFEEIERLLSVGRIEIDVPRMTPDAAPSITETITGIAGCVIGMPLAKLPIFTTPGEVKRREIARTADMLRETNERGKSAIESSLTESFRALERKLASDHDSFMNSWRTEAKSLEGNVGESEQRIAEETARIKALAAKAAELRATIKG